MEQQGLGITVEQNLKDAYKLYRYGSLVPNSTGGLQESEDEAMGDLIKRGETRSEETAFKLYKKCKSICYTKSQIEVWIEYLSQKLSSQDYMSNEEFILKK